MSNFFDYYIIIVAYSLKKKKNCDATGILTVQRLPMTALVNQKLQTVCRPEDYIRRNKAESFNRKLSDTISGTIPSLIYISC